MNNDTKLIIQQKIDNASFNTRGAATISLENVDSINVQMTLDEIKNTPAYSRLTFEYNKELNTVKIVDPDENIEGFENTHPSRKPCN